MIKLIYKKPDINKSGTVLFINTDSIDNKNFTTQQNAYIKKQLELEKTIFTVSNGDETLFCVVTKDDMNAESFRIAGSKVYSQAQEHKVEELVVYAENTNSEYALAFAEGIELSTYRFIKYFSEEKRDKKSNTVKNIIVYHHDIKDSDINYLNNTIKSVFWARDMVNEPVLSLNAEKLATEISEKLTEAGVSVEVFDKKKIESLRMGGVLSVNKGSIDPPTFTIAEWNPTNAVNERPFVLVGKGVVYDTGGLSLKPTAGSMDFMKSDMAGAAAVASTVLSIALNNIPVRVIALIPATDNRPSGNAYAPGDVIKMYNGLHVEVMNTDAEGRLILADALSYADKYEPQLVIDMATLTGSAMMAIGKYASVYMGNAEEVFFTKLNESGDSVNERLVKFPFWNEYGESLKSDIADLKNLGEREAGSISAGKFLEHFTKSPYIHIDIAGTAFAQSTNNYIPKGATGVGVRLLSDFFKKISKQPKKN